VPGFHYTESGQAHKPYIAMAKIFPLRTLVVGHNDLSTGGVLRHDPDNYAMRTQVTEPASTYERRQR